MSEILTPKLYVSVQVSVSGQADTHFAAELVSGKLEVGTAVTLRKVELDSHCVQWVRKGSLVRVFGTAEFEIVEIREKARMWQLVVRPYKKPKKGRVKE